MRAKVAAEVYCNRIKTVFQTQIMEIMWYRQKESQKRGYDVGEGRAGREWIEKYAEIFREEWKGHH
jgi:hypothetical protein